MMPATYDKIASYTIPSATPSYTFTSIPSTYTDIVFVIDNLASSASVLDFAIRFNGDTGTNYSNTDLYGNGSTAGSGRNSNHTSGKLVYMGSSSWITMLKGNVQNYSNSTTNKTVLTRADSANSGGAALDVVLWRNTAAITSIGFLMTSGNIQSGATFTLYGIKAA